MDGKKIGEETLNFRTFQETTANYVVHQAFTIWRYQQMSFTPHMKRRSDGKKGKKPWGQKGSGRARHGSRYSPLFGRSATNKAPHGLDNKRKKKLARVEHAIAISTVLQSKWKGMKIVCGLEEWEEARQKPLERCLEKWTKAKEMRRKRTLLITRSGFGEMHERLCVLTPESYNSPLYLSGRHIPRLEMRRPKDIDPVSDGLEQCLKCRRLVISREAFFDLDAKFNKETGWAFQNDRMIEVNMLRKLVQEFPVDREKEIEVARTLPQTKIGREFWARDQRAELQLSAAA